MGYLDVKAKIPYGQFEWKPWWLWVAANGLTAVANVGIAYITSPIRDWLSMPFWLFLTLNSLLEGAALGLLQGLVWRRYVPAVHLRAWVTATMIGTMLGLVAVFIVTLSTSFLIGCCLPLLLILPGAVHGAMLGLAQRRVLQPHFNEETRWVRVNALAGVVSLIPIVAGAMWALISVFSGLSAASVGASGTMPNLTVSGFVDLGVFLSVLAGSLLYGAVTGGAFERLVRLYAEQGS
jgi:hypothetical protein